MTAPPTATPLPAPTLAPSPVATYQNANLGVSLQYPASWKPNESYCGQTQIPCRYEGADGFFMVDAMSGLPDWSVDKAAEPQARHKLRPYGDDPEIVAITVGGQEARLIMPRESKISEAALVARYPEPPPIGGGRYNFFWLYADRTHIEQIARTIRFLPRTG